MKRNLLRGAAMVSLLGASLFYLVVGHLHLMHSADRAAAERRLTGALFGLLDADRLATYASLSIALRVLLLGLSVAMAPTLVLWMASCDRRSGRAQARGFAWFALILGALFLVVGSIALAPFMLHFDRLALADAFGMWLRALVALAPLAGLLQLLRTLLGRGPVLGTLGGLALLLLVTGLHGASVQGFLHGAWNVSDVLSFVVSTGERAWPYVLARVAVAVVAFVGSALLTSPAQVFDNPIKFGVSHV